MEHLTGYDSVQKCSNPISIQLTGSVRRRFRGINHSWQTTVQQLSPRRQTLTARACCCPVLVLAGFISGFLSVRTENSAPTFYPDPIFLSWIPNQAVICSPAPFTAQEASAGRLSLILIAPEI